MRDMIWAAAFAQAVEKISHTRLATESDMDLGQRVAEEATNAANLAVSVFSFAERAGLTWKKHG